MVVDFPGAKVKPAPACGGEDTVGSVLEGEEDVGEEGAEKGGTLPRSHPCPIPE